MNCPRCAQVMQPHVLDGQLGRAVEIDICPPCQSIWFDALENLQLSAGATLTLFRLIGERVGRAAPDHRDLAKCPRCQAQLRRTQDMQRATHFQYFRCPNNHGRLTTFFDFLKEKNFVKPLTPNQIGELRKTVQSVNCANCGGAVDLARGSDCGHCGSPLSMLDVHQAETLIAQLRAADQPKPIDPALPLALARARRESEAAFQGMPGHENWHNDSWSMGLVGAGLSEFIRLIKRDA